MNRIHKIVWSAVKEKWIVVSEKAGATGCPIVKGGLLSLAALLSLGTPAFALAPGELPAGGAITAGSGTIAAAGNAMTVTQTSQKLIADWKTFNIGAQASVRFDQPGVTAAALNRIHDLNPSQIMGQLNSNGQVFLLNQSGIIFGKTAQVNVGGLVGTSLYMADIDFLASKYQLTKGGGAGSVVNQGSINAIPGGVVALIAPQVENQGTITADGGSVALLAGNKVTVDFGGDGLISYVIDEGAVNSQAANSGLIKADGGLVVMSAEAADELTSAAVNNSGIIEARTLGEREGKIVLLSDMKTGKTTVGGTLDASAPDGGNGGFIETSGANVTVGSDAAVDTRSANGSTGTWLLDPVDFTITTSGGDITGATLSTALGTSSVTIHTQTGTNSGTDNYGASGTNGDIFVNDAVSWNSHSLTLNAYRNVRVNSTMSVTGTGGLFVEYGQGAVASGNTSSFKTNSPINLASGTTFQTKWGSDGSTFNFTIINSLNGLQNINTSGLGLNYVLGSNIDASATSTWNSDASVGYYGFIPIGGVVSQSTYHSAMTGDALAVLGSYSFTGSFEGAGHTISNLTINRPNDTFVGLFALTFNQSNSRRIENLTLSNANVSGLIQVGSLVGFAGPYDTIYNVTVSSSAVNGQAMVGGLLGGSAGNVSNCGATDIVVTQTGDFTTFYNLSGIGRNNGGDQDYSSFGGLIGSGDGASINNCYVTSTGTNTSRVIGANDSRSIGGLVGEINYNTQFVSMGFPVPNTGIINSFSAATVSMGIQTTATFTLMSNNNVSVGSVGGLVGSVYGLTVSNSYSRGTVTVGDGISSSDYNHPMMSNIGGLVGQLGRNYDDMTQVPIVSQSYSTDSITVGSNANSVGGLVGGAWGASITQSYSTGRVTAGGKGGYGFGGLIGQAGNTGNSGTVYNSWIANCYTTDFVTVTLSANGVGGFIGGLNSGGAGLSTITNSYSTGMVINGVFGSTGGFYGNNNGTISGSYWDTSTSGMSNGSNSGVTGLTTSQLMSGLQSGWISGTWGIINGVSYPYFNWNYSMHVPEVFSGTLNVTSGSAAGKNIVIAGNGNVVAQTITGANGFYYTLMPFDTVLPGTKVLIFTNGASYSDGTTPMRANHVSYVNTEEQCIGYDLYAGITFVSRNNATLALDPTVSMINALGSLGGSSYLSDILYTANGSSVTLNADTIFKGKSSPGITISGAVNANGHFLAIESAGPVTQGAAITNVSSLVLTNVGSSVPLFTLNSLGNSFDNLVATTNGGNIWINDSKSLVIGSVNSLYFGALYGANVGSGTLMLNVPIGAVTQTSSAPITAGTLELEGGNFDFTTSSTNQIGTLAGQVSNIAVKNNGSIIVGRGPSDDGLAATGTVSIFANGSSADITLNQAVSSGASGNAVVLASGRNFVNNFGAGGIILSSGGRWLVYSANPANDTFGGLNSGNKAIWNATYAGNPPAGVASGNRYLFSLSPTLTVTSTNTSKTYGQDATSNVASAYTLSALQGAYGGAIVADVSTDFGTPTVTSSGSGFYVAVSGSPYAITAAQGSMTSNGYALNFVSSGTLTINKVTLTLTGSRVYDGGTTFDGVDFGTAGSISTGILGETISLTGSGTVGSKRVDFGAQTIAPGGFTLNNGTGGGLAINYQIAAIGNTGTFTAKPLTVTGLTADDKVYNGNNSAHISGTAVFGGKVGSDDLTINTGSITVTFADPNAANNKPINLAGVALSGADASNYTSQGVSGLTANITQAPVTLIGSRAYNALMSFNGSVFGAISTGILSETLTVTGVGSVTSKDVTGSPQSLTIGGLTLANGSGLASNYQIAASGNTGIVTKATVALAGSRAYNGLLTLNSSDFGTISTGVGTETLMLTGAGSVGSKDVSVSAQNLTTGTLALADGTGGGLANNYQIAASGNTGIVTKATVALSGSRAYNGLLTFNGSDFGTFSTGILSETLTVTGAGSVGSKDVSVSAQSLTTGTLALANGTGGGLANNYQIAASGNTGIVTKATVALSGSRAYNGLLTFNGSDFGTSGTINTGVGTEILTLTGAGSVGSKDVSVSAQSLTTGTLELANGTGGGMANNYQIAASGNTATITKAHLTVTADDQSKVYGDNNPTLTSTLNGFVTGENLENSGVTGSALSSTTATASSDVRVGGYVIMVSNGTLGASNYDFTTFTPGTLTITQAPLTVSGYGGSRLYGGNNSSIAYTGTLNGKKFLSDDVTLTASSIDEGITTASNAGTYNGVLTLGIIGAKSANYTLASSTGNLTINPAPLSVTANDASKTYDGTPYSGGNGVVYSGFVNSQNLSALSGALTYGGSSQGAVNTGSYEITPIGLTSGNYHITFIDGMLSIESAISEPKQVPVETLSSVDHGYGSSPAPLYVVTGNGVVPGAISIVVSGSNVVVSVPSDQAQSGSSFQFSLPSGVGSGLQSLTVTLADGSTLPPWLSYNPADHSISASDIPEGALPVSVQIKQGDQTWTIQITAASISGVSS